MPETFTNGQSAALGNSVVLPPFGNCWYYPSWAGGSGNNPGTPTFNTAQNIGTACNDINALGNVFRFMDATYPVNSPKNTSNSNLSFGSLHGGGANFLFSDVTVRFMTNDINLANYEALGTRNENEPVILPAP